MKNYEDKNNQKIHAIRRAKERYNLDFTEKDIGKIISLIQTNRAIQITLNFLDDRNVFKLNYKNLEIYPVYNKKLQSIHTFLTKQMVDEDSF